MIELALSKLQKYYGASMVLEDITFEVKSNERVGIIGVNGSGKTTLFKIIMGIEGYEKGMLSMRKGATLGYLEQMPLFPKSFKVIDVLKEAFNKLHSLQKEMELLEKELSVIDEAQMNRTLNKYSEVQTLYEGLGGYEQEEKLSRVCTGLKINDEFKDKIFDNLSGGEKTTVILGKILLENPDILLLDEPSNHLDLEAMEWLEAYLKDYKGAVLIISHDRYFLDNVATKIVEIEDMTCKTYEGNYSDFIKEKETQLQLQLEHYEDQQKKINAMEKSIAQLRDWAIRADNNKFFRRAASMQKALDKLQRVPKPVMERRSINIDVNTSGRSGNNVVTINNLSKSYGKNMLLNKAELLIRKGEAVALIGANGSGKSTLIKILLGMEKADEGTAILGSSIKLAYLPQNITFDNEENTVLECFRENIVITEGKGREYLAKYMFFGEMVFKRVGGLSGGERTRLKLAILMYEEINLLIMDEPTNHLDIPSREELEELLKEFQGTVLFVSHDRQFINNIARRVVELRDGLLISYEGDYDYYKEKSSQLKYSLSAKAPSEEENSAKNKKNRVQDNSKPKGNQWKKAALEKEIEEAEEKLKAVEEDITRVSDDYEQLNSLYNEKLELQSIIEKLMEEYFS
ncbi:ribosomal protection-like ABC-F family protein [Clostridium polynesiense]|uniref:ribosomal protection-like ABC-F family protein n=1 Tax=Clostridium polynesiense TaxID=1325933 RepID=UPI0005906F55|nr:ABC-F type ribosomal protection protein [Clostridium polynesiense]